MKKIFLVLAVIVLSASAIQAQETTTYWLKSVTLGTFNKFTNKWTYKDPVFNSFKLTLTGKELRIWDEAGTTFQMGRKVDEVNDATSSSITWSATDEKYKTCSVSIIKWKNGTKTLLVVYSDVAWAYDFESLSSFLSN